jgi:hypothetical protein
VGMFLCIMQLIKGKEPRVAKMMENSRQLKVGEMFERFYEMFT